MKVAYFPLRSSVELFKGPASVEPISRAKHAAILYDHVVFESGLFEESIGPGGSMSVHIPPEAATKERRERARVVHEKGSGFQVGIRFEPEDGEPADTIDPFISTELEASYTAEWHTGITDELQVLKPDWASPIHLTEQQLADVTPAIDEIKRSLSETEPAGDVSVFHKTFIIDALSRDAAVAAVMGAAVQVTSLFEPFLPRLDASPDHPGRMTLEVAVGGIDQLAWEQIAEFREHPGSSDARAKLRDVEERVAVEGLDDPQFAVRVGQEITTDLFAAMSELKGSLPKKLAKEGINAGVSLLPVMGSYASAVSAAEVIGEAAIQERTWYAALMKLRGAAQRR